MKTSRREFIGAATGLAVGATVARRAIAQPADVAAEADFVDDKEPAPPGLTANWIWKKQVPINAYNQTIYARRAFRLPKIKKATIAISADSAYRLFINNEWINDGPCRSWPEHYQYDLIDVTPFLHSGKNEILVIARYFGAGTFHQIPQHPGLLVQLDAEPVKGRAVRLVSDGRWEIADASEWERWVPKVSIQMEPWELHDAQRSPQTFSKASIVCAAQAGPWKDLHPRDCRLLTRQPKALRRVQWAKIVEKPSPGPTFLVAQIMRPGLVEANHSCDMAHAFSTVIVAETPQKIRFTFPEYDVTVNGTRGENDLYELKEGRNLLLAAYRHPYGHAKETSILYLEAKGVRYENPLGKDFGNPWCFVPAVENGYVSTDLFFITHPNPERDAAAARARQALDKLLENAVDEASFARIAGDRARSVPPEYCMTQDAEIQFELRKPIATADSLLESPSALMFDNAEATRIQPSAEGDVELAYDLGEQACGYYAIDLMADAGTVVDVFGVEYIAPDGTVQHTWGNRNGMRYVCKQGRNTFTSLRRRSGRYLFITLRNQQTPVEIRKVEVVESTYPVDRRGAFSCSDHVLDRVWGISERTLELCMEDTFTDCPLYEQTLWVGDARNEALFAMNVFGADDLAKRCATLAAQSLDRFPLVGCQVPSAWECLLPAWSFLWGISVWDCYFYDGNKAFLEAIWPCVLKNLRGAEERCTDRGLFSAPYWNLFEWSTIDDNHNTVTHNNLLLIGAIDAALKCAQALGDAKAESWLTEFRAKIKTAVNILWDKEKKAYRDSINEQGVISEHTSQHTSFLGLLYDVIDEKDAKDAINNCLNPPQGMSVVSSGFAMMFLYDALEKMGENQAIIDSIYKAYVPMLEAGATTVWEVFPFSLAKPAGFPARSHCHAWSSAPVYFLNRIILGVRQTAIAGATYSISPWISSFNHAQGIVAGARGDIEVKWSRQEDALNIIARAPEGVKLEFARNASMEGYKVSFNGQEAKAV